MHKEYTPNIQNIVKGLLISSVIFFHALLLMALPNANSVLTDHNLLLTFFPFLLMVFFFYAGYNYAPGKRTPKENIKRRTFQLLIPFVITFFASTLLIMAICLPTGTSMEAIGQSIVYSLLSEPLSLMIGYPSNGVICFDLLLALGLLWFIYALYIVSIVFFLTVDYLIKEASRLISAIFLLLVIGFCLGQFVGTYLPYTCQCYPVILAIMLLAAYLKQFNFLDKKPENKKELGFLIINAIVAELIVVGIGLFGYFYYGTTMLGALPGGMFNSYIKGYDAFVSFILGFLGTYAVHQAARVIGKIPVVSFLFEWYGRHSTYVYLFHTIVLSFIHRVIFRGEHVLGGFQAFAYSFMTIGIMILIFIVVDAIIRGIKHKKQSPAEAK